MPHEKMYQSSHRDDDHHAKKEDLEGLEGSRSGLSSSSQMVGTRCVQHAEPDCRA